MTPLETLALIIAEQRTEIERLHRDCEKWPTRVESESALLAYRKAIIEECARQVDTWPCGRELSVLADKIRGLAHN